MGWLFKTKEEKIAKLERELVDANKKVDGYKTAVKFHLQAQQTYAKYPEKTTTKVLNDLRDAQIKLLIATVEQSSRHWRCPFLDGDHSALR